jgi:membrane protease subunit HflC
MKRSPVAILLVLVVALIALQQSAFIVDQTEKALVLQLGKPVRGAGPGLHFKLPFVQNVIFFDARLLDYDAQPSEVLTKDKKTLEVDNYSKWRIADPLTFYTTVRSIPRAQARLDDIIYSEMRVALGKYTLIEIVSSKRAEIMEQVTRESNKLISQFGIIVNDVRIKGTDLPPENARAIYGRMRAERERQARQYRSVGKEEAAKIKAATDKERSIILAEAGRQAEILKGQGDAQAIKIYAEALRQDPSFYEFQKSLEAYKKGLKGSTRFVLTPNNEFLRYMDSPK